MPKAQSKGCQRKNRIHQRPGVNEQQIDSDSCSTLGLTKTVIDEKIAAFFKDRPFFYDIEMLMHVRRPCVHRAVAVQ